MRVDDQLAWTWSALATDKGRSLLTALGIAIGIGAIVLLTTIGEGIRLYLMDSFSQFGSRIIAVTPGRRSTGGISGGLLSSVRPLSLADAEALGRLPHVVVSMPIVQGTARVEAGRMARDTDVYGVGPSLDKAWNFKTQLGRGFFATEGGARYEALIGAKVREELFANYNPLGQFVRIGGSRFRVVGVMEPKGQLLGVDLDDAVYIPASLALAMYDRAGLMEIDVVFRESITSKAMSESVDALMMARHGEQDFTLFTQEDMLSSLDRILGMLKFAIGALGGIALLVGGVGVLTIMSMSLRERIPEIGLLRALGTTRREILMLFLIESMLLSGLGGLLGVVVLLSVQFILSAAVPAFPLALQPQYLLFGVLLSLVVGLIAGLSPAYRAANLDPVDALRTE